MLNPNIDPDYIRRRDAAMAKAIAIVEAAAVASYAKYPPPPPVICSTNYLPNSGAADTPILGITTIEWATLMQHGHITALLAYCEAKAISAQKLADTYEKLGCAANVQRQVGVVEAMIDVQQKLRRILLWQALVDATV